MNTKFSSLLFLSSISKCIVFIVWSCTSIHPYVFMTWFLIKQDAPSQHRTLLSTGTLLSPLPVIFIPWCFLYFKWILFIVLSLVQHSNDLNPWMLICTHLSIHPTIHPSIYMSVHLSNHPSIILPIKPPNSLFTYVCQSICLSIGYRLQILAIALAIHTEGK